MRENRESKPPGRPWRSRGKRAWLRPRPVLLTIAHYTAGGLVKMQDLIQKLCVGVWDSAVLLSSQMLPMLWSMDHNGQRKALTEAGGRAESRGEGS